MKDIFEQHERKKYKRIRCPKCGSTSKVIPHISSKFLSSLQVRVCNSCNYQFDYDYKIQAYLSMEDNWKCSI